VRDLDRVGSPSKEDLRMQTDTVSKTLCSLAFRIPNDGQSLGTQ
jgi:hypothetical protein